MVSKHITSSNAEGDRRDRRDRAMLVGLYLLSRLVLHVSGVRFDLRPLATSWHILDPVWLRDDLLRNAFYMPGQPPLYNLMLGLVMKLTRDEQLLGQLFRGLYGAMSLLTCLLLFGLLRGLAIPRWLALGATGLFMLSPALMLYEHIPYYSVPVLLLLTACSALFRRAIDGGFYPLLALFLTMATLVCTRSLFQVHWYLALTALCLLLRPKRRRAICTAAAGPLLVILALYTKNGVVTGHFATSSWLGLSMVKLTVHALPHPVREQLVARGSLSPLALRDTTYDPPEALAPYFARTPRTGIPVLDQPKKSTDHTNYSHLAYVAVSADALRDSLYVVRHYPGVYLRSVGEAFVMFMRPASDYPYVHPNRDLIEPWGRVYARLLAGQPRYPVAPQFALEPGTVGYGVLVGYLACIGFGLYVALRGRLRERSSEDASLLFMWLNIGYVSLVGNAFEIGENQRFRFSLHPLMITCLAMLAHRLYQAAMRARTARTVAEPPGAGERAP